MRIHGNLFYEHRKVTESLMWDDLACDIMDTWRNIDGWTYVPLTKYPNGVAVTCKTRCVMWQEKPNWENAVWEREKLVHGVYNLTAGVTGRANLQPVFTGVILADRSMSRLCTNPLGSYLPCEITCGCAGPTIFVKILHIHHQYCIKNHTNKL